MSFDLPDVGATVLFHENNFFSQYLGCIPATKKDLMVGFFTRPNISFQDSLIKHNWNCDLTVDCEEKEFISFINHLRKLNAPFHSWKPVNSFNSIYSSIQIFDIAELEILNNESIIKSASFENEFYSGILKTGKTTNWRKATDRSNITSKGKWGTNGFPKLNEGDPEMRTHLRQLYVDIYYIGVNNRIIRSF